MDAPKSTQQWFYAVGNVKQGPFDKEQMQTFIGTGAVSSRTLVWSSDMANWEKLSQTDLAVGLRPHAGDVSAPVTGFGEAISTCFQKYIRLSGRANRPEYWYFILFTFLVEIGAMVLDSVIFGQATQILPFVTITQLAFFLPSLAVAFRRLHDTDRSGWWLLIGIVPLAGLIVLIVFFTQQGTSGRNRYD